jgi:hypothetical protein
MTINYDNRFNKTFWQFILIPTVICGGVVGVAWWIIHSVIDLLK